MMLSLFEEELGAQQNRVLDVRCASCGSTGQRLAGETCEYCLGAGWLVLGDHEPPCAACNDPGRATRPAPPGYWWVTE